MLELLIVSMCAVSSMKQNACGSALIAYRQQSDAVKTWETRFNNVVIKDMPDDLKYVGGAAGVLYNRQLKVKVYRGTYVDIREGQEVIGYEFKF